MAKVTTGKTKVLQLGIWAEFGLSGNCRRSLKIEMPEIPNFLFPTEASSEDEPRHVIILKQTDRTNMCVRLGSLLERHS